MKKCIISFCLFVVAVLCANGQIINIPDANFKNNLVNGCNSCLFFDNNFISGQLGSPVIIDANHDGEIEQSEALSVGFIRIDYCSISDATGIEHFTNLKGINISHNQISTINLAPLTNLETIQISYNQLTSINTTSLPNLKMVYCGHNLLSSLDFMDNPLFEDLGCNYNPNLTTIKIKNNHTQLFGSQTLLIQCWDNNPNLNYICADAAEIPALQSFLASCNMTQAITIDSACELGVEGFNESEVGIFPNPSTGVVYLDNTNNSFKTVQVYNSIGQLISTQTLGVAASTSIDLSGCSKGVYLLNFQGEKGGKSCKVVKE